MLYNLEYVNSVNCHSLHGDMLYFSVYVNNVTENVILFT